MAAVVIKSSSFRDKFRKGIKSISHKLQIFGATGRSRSRSIGDVERSSTNPRSSVAPSTVASQTSLHVAPLEQTSKSGSGSRILPSGGDFASISNSQPSGSVTRRFSMLGSKGQEGVPSPRRQTIQLASPNLSLRPTSPDPVDKVVDHPPTSIANHPVNRGFIVHRKVSPHPADLAPSIVKPSSLDVPHAARPMTSSTSLDKVKQVDKEPTPHGLQRRQSTDMNHKVGPTNDKVVRGRQHSSDEKGFGSRLVRLLSRNNSQRSRFRKREKIASGSSDVEESAMASASNSPAEASRRLSLDETFSGHSIQTFASGSHPSNPVPLVVGDDGDHLGRIALGYRSRTSPHVRRGSSLSDQFSRRVEEEEIDWNEPLSDDDDYDQDDYDPGSKSVIPQSAPNLPPTWGQGSHESLELNLTSHLLCSPVSIVPTLDTIPDASPSAGLTAMPAVSFSPPRPRLAAPASPSSSHSPSEFGQRSSSRASAHATNLPLHAHLVHDRARSPLNVDDDPEHHSIQNRPTSPAMVNEDETDQGLAISIGSRRGRKQSLLRNKSISKH